MMTAGGREGMKEALTTLSNPSLIAPLEVPKIIKSDWASACACIIAATGDAANSISMTTIRKTMANTYGMT